MSSTEKKKKKKKETRKKDAGRERKKKEIFKQQKNPAPEQNRRLVSEARVKETERKRAARTRNMAGGGRRGYAIETRIPSWLE